MESHTKLKTPQQRVSQIKHELRKAKALHRERINTLSARLSAAEEERESESSEE